MVIIHVIKTPGDTFSKILCGCACCTFGNILVPFPPTNIPISLKKASKIFPKVGTFYDTFLKIPQWYGNSQWWKSVYQIHQKAPQNIIRQCKDTSPPPPTAEIFPTFFCSGGGGRGMLYSWMEHPLHIPQWTKDISEYLYTCPPPAPRSWHWPSKWWGNKVHFVS